MTTLTTATRKGFAQSPNSLFAYILHTSCNSYETEGQNNPTPLTVLRSVPLTESQNMNTINTFYVYHFLIEMRIVEIRNDCHKIFNFTDHVNSVSNHYYSF
jgi:hypothetical protein